MKKKEAEYFYNAIKLNHFSSYRKFRNKIVDENFCNLRNDANISLSLLQRSTEFFNI